MGRLKSPRRNPAGAEMRLFHRVANGILTRWFQLDFTDVSSVKSLFK